MTRIAVGLDYSAAARSALRWAAHFAVASEAEVIAVHSWEPSYDAGDAEAYEELVEKQRSLLLGAWVEPAVDMGATVTTLMPEGDARKVLLATAEDEGADLLVTGRTGAAGGPGFLHLGSVAEYAAHHSPIPLAVIPSGWSGETSRILVGVDGSPESLSAIGWVTTFAPDLGASVIAVQVAEPFLEWTPASSPQNWRRDVERDLEKWTAPLRERGVQVDLVAQRDLYPADGLLGVAAARHADLVVIGARGTGGFTGLRVGGVALKVLHRATLPLVLVPPTWSGARRTGT